MRFSGEIKKNSHVLHSVSIGEEKQTGQDYAEMVELIINNPSIKKVTILKADTLQRFRIRFLKQITEKEAEDEARSISKDWEEKNKTAILKQKDNKELTIKEWDDYRGKESFKKNYEKVKALYEVNEGKEFRDHVNNLANHFVQKLQEALKKCQQHNYKRSELFAAMKDYCLEECSVLICLSEEEPVYDYELYRGIRNKPMQFIHQRFITPRVMSAVAILDGDYLSVEKDDKGKSNSNPDNPYDFSFFKRPKQEQELDFSYEMSMEKQWTFKLQIDTSLSQAVVINFRLINLIKEFKVSDDKSSMLESGLVKYKKDINFLLKMTSSGQLHLSFQLEPDFNFINLFIEKVVSLIMEYSVNEGKEKNKFMSDYQAKM